MEERKSKVILITQPQREHNFEIKHKGKTTIVLFFEKSDFSNCDINIEITSKNALVDILGVVIASGKKSIRLNTLQDHKEPSSTSDLLIKTALFGSIRFYYQGLIKIAQKAQKSNAYQKNQNLLLSDDAWAESKPYLEIIANDVRCTHGATIGRIDQKQLFYLQTRGIRKNKAWHLLTVGFFREVLERIDDKKIRVDLIKRADKRLNELLN